MMDHDDGEVEEDEGDEGDDGVFGEDDDGVDGNNTRGGRSPPISKAITASNLFCLKGRHDLKFPSRPRRNLSEICHHYSIMQILHQPKSHFHTRDFIKAVSIYEHI